MRLLVSLILLPVVSALATVEPAALEAARKLFGAAGQSAEAQRAFEIIVAADPSCAEAQRALAELALWRDDSDQAIAYAEKAVALAPDNDVYQTTLGDACGRAAQKASIFRQPGLAKKCLAAYLRAAELAPNNVRRHQNLLEFYRQAPSIVGGGIDRALAEAAKIKKLDPRQGSVAFATLYTSEKKYAQALAELDEFLTAAPDDYDTLYQVGKLAALSGQFLERGVSALQRCLQLTPPPHSPSLAAVQLRLGNICEAKHDPAGARSAYQAALRIDPKFSPASDALKKLK